MKSILALFVLLSTANAFVVVPSANRLHSSTVGLKMSDNPMGNVGVTERLLLEHKRSQELGLVQEYGCTVKKDGLDGVRAFVWGIFDVSNVVFPVMGVALSLGLALNLAGYGYYFDQGSLVVDTLQTIQQDQMFQEEVVKLAAGAVEQASLF